MAHKEVNVDKTDNLVVFDNINFENKKDWEIAKV